MFLPEIPPPTEPSKSSPKKGESHKESETQPPPKQDKLILSRIPKQSDIVEDKKTSGKASGDLTSGVSRLPTRDQRSPSKQKPRNELTPDSSNQEPNGKTQTKTVVGASGIATTDHVKDVAKRSASAKKGEDQAKTQSTANDIKLKEQDTTKSKAATAKSPMTEETSHIPPIQSNDKKTKESSKLTVTPVKSDTLPSEVGKESPSDSPSVGLSMSVKPGRQVEIQNKSTQLVQQTTIGPKDSTEKDITERSELGGGLKPEEKVSVGPALRDQGTELLPEEKRTKPVEKSLKKSDKVTSDQNKVLPTVLASEVKRVKPEDAAPASPVTYSVDPELANKASEPKKLLTDKNIIPTVGELPSFSSNLTDPEVEENSSKEAGSSIQTEAVTVLAKNVGNQVDKGVLIVAGQQKDSNERLSDPAVGNTDSPNSCREEPKSIIMQDGAEEKASKPGKPVTLLKPDTAEQTQAAGTDAQEEKNVTNVMEKEQVTNKPSAFETKSESNIGVEKKAKVLVEKTEKQIKAIVENNKKEPKELQPRNEEITITQSNLKEMIIVNQTPELKDFTNVNVRIKEGNKKEISNRTADIEVLKDQVSSMAIVNKEINKAVEDTSLSAISKSLSANLDMQTKAVKVEKKSLENQVPQIDASRGTDDTKRAKVTEEERKTKESSMKDSVINAENIVQPTVIGKDDGQVGDKLKPDTQTGQREEPKIEPVLAKRQQEGPAKQQLRPTVTSNKDSEPVPTMVPGANLDKEPKTQTKDDAKLSEKSSVSTEQNNTGKQTNHLKEDKAIENKATKKEDVAKTKVDSEQTCAEVASSQRGGEHQKVKVNGPVEMVKSGNTEKKNDDKSKLLTKEEQVKDNKVKESTGPVVQEGEIPEPKPFAVNTQSDEGLGETKDSKTISENETVDKQVSLNTVTTTVPDENKNKAMSFANESANTSQSCKAKVQEDQTAGVLGNQSKDGTEVDKHRTPKTKVENKTQAETKDSANTANDSRFTKKTSEKEAKKSTNKGKKGTIGQSVENKVTKQEVQQVKPPEIDSTQESELCLSKNSDQEPKDKISVILVECPATTAAEKKDGDTKNLTKPADQTTSTVKLPAEKSTLPTAKGPVAVVEEKSGTGTAQQIRESKGVEGITDKSGSRDSSVMVSSNETPTLTENHNEVNISENQKPLIQNKVNLQDSSKHTTPEAKMAGRDDNQQVTPLQDQKPGLLCNQDKYIMQSKNNLEEQIKMEMKESKELADSPKESRVLINEKITREMDKKQKELSQDVPEVKIKQAKPDDQKKSIKDAKEGENKTVKMPNHADAQEDGGNTKAPVKTSIGLKTQQLLQTKDGASNLGVPQMLNVSDFLRAHGKKSATQNLQLNKESPSSWLDVEHQPKKKKESRRILDTSTSEDESLEPDDLDEFVRSIREGSTPFTQPQRKHTRKKTPSPAMPAIKEDNFDPDSFQFGLRKNNSIFKDPSPAMMIKQNSANRKGRVQETASRDQTEARLKSADGVDGKTGVQGGTDAGKEEPPVNGEEAGKLSSRLQRISILSSLMSSPWSSRKVREEVASAKDSAAPPSGGKAGAASPPLEADKQGVDKGKSQSPAGAGLSALSALAGGPASPPAVPSFAEVKLPAHLEKYVKKSKSETETSQAPKQQTKPSPKGSGGKGKASMAGAPNASSSKSSVNGLSTPKHKVRPEL